MQRDFLDRLSENVRTVVQQTEDAAGINITVVVDPERGAGSPYEPGLMACEVDEHGAEIFIVDAGYFPDASVFHEVQHIRRILLEGAPRLTLCQEFNYWSPELDTAMAQLDNNLEHLVIVPRELQIYPQRREYWEGRVRRMLDRLSGNELLDIDRRRFALLAWILVNDMTPNEVLKEDARRILRELGIEDRANQFRETILAAGNSKEKVVLVTLEFLELPRKAGCLEYFETANGSSAVVCVSDLPV
jgi:hypothetical protein